MDYYLGAVHEIGRNVTNVESFIEDHHGKLMALVTDCDFVDVIAHPWVIGHKYAARGVIDSWRFAYIPEEMLKEFAQAMVDHGKVLELNSSAQLDFDDPMFGQFMSMAKEAGVAIAIGSDAHEMDAVGNSLPLDVFAQKMDFQPRHIWMPKGK